MYNLLRHLPVEAVTVGLLLDLPPAQERWSAQEHLLAAAVDALRGANWQRTGKGPRPKPVPRPGEQARRTVLKGDSMSPADLTAELERRRSLAVDGGEQVGEQEVVRRGD